MNDGESKAAPGVPRAVSQGRGGAMRITVEEHLRWILERVEPLPIGELPLSLALGRTLAEEVCARHSLPLWDNSAMDGYAVRAADLATASADAPVRLAVRGEVLAGSAADPAIPSGSAVRIMTGAPLPAQADAVVPVEQTRGDREGRPWAEESVQVLAAVPVGANVRRRGEDTAAGAVLATAGAMLTAGRAAALAAAGVAGVRVHASPRVVVIATGSELRAPGETLARGQIPESNSLLIAGLLRELGIETERVDHTSDDPSALAEELRMLASTCDAVITTGGVGPGTHDVVRIALEREPGVRAVPVAVRPGQPQCVGRLRPAATGAPGAFIFALPGNPVSAAASFELFVRPALLAMQGRRDVHRLRLTARASRDWRGAPDRLQVLPVVISNDDAVPGALVCTPAVNPRGVSHAVGGHGAANGYALVEVERGDVRAGEPVTVVVMSP